MSRAPLKYYYNQQPSSVDTKPQPQSRPTMDSKRYSSRTICFKTGDVISLTLTMSL
ncbi:MAG: hypothetical protein H0A76_05810 [Candidatus Thiodubiliella endoseptemdiera]|uniref:Uncharacterized protein n=1 Tax=Candidatus Thiodubiliella endoseptemdiera TaxID=2738886 RepID=A0A853F0R8_9GAMM|nr:hypothetical protein [Candidatus Thiodubiliella endoseptemdiera]